jgi:hypothetical protein
LGVADGVIVGLGIGVEVEVGTGVGVRVGRIVEVGILVDVGSDAVAEQALTMSAANSRVLVTSRDIIFCTMMLMLTSRRTWASAAPPPARTEDTA